MRFGIVGDVHAEDRNLAIALERLAALQIDKVLCVGDVADGNGSVDRCVELLERYDVSCVIGNHDAWLLTGLMRDLDDATRPDDIGMRSRTYLACLPATLELDTPEGALLLCHGLGSNNMARLNEDDFDFAYARDNHPELQELLADHYAFVVCGHTHRPFARTYRGVTFVNAGTLKDDHAPGFAIFDTVLKRLEWMPLDGAG